MESCCVWDSGVHPHQNFIILVKTFESNFPWTVSMTGEVPVLILPLEHTKPAKEFSLGASPLTRRDYSCSGHSAEGNSASVQLL